MTSILASSLLFSGCKKEGCMDSTALNFNTDVNKDDGTCIYNNATSQTISVAQNEWSGGGGGYEVSKSAPIITAEIASTGAVLCYFFDGDDWTPMPLTYSFGSFVSHILYTYNTGVINFVSFDDDGLSPNPGAVTFKVVCISSKGMIQNPDLDLNDYEAVKEVFEL